MTKHINIGDRVKDAINGYEGVVYGFEVSGSGESVLFAETLNPYQHLGTNLGATHRIKVNNVRVIESRVRTVTTLSGVDRFTELEQRVTRLMEYLKVEEVHNPESYEIKEVKPSGEDNV